MDEFNLLPVAYARTVGSTTSNASKPVTSEPPRQPLTAEAVASEHTTEAAEAAHEGGLEIQFSTIAFQALNFLVLVIVLHKILYKPLLKILSEREKKIRDGVENAEKAEGMLKESNQIRQDMIKNANTESQDILEKARKSGEEMKTGILQDAHKEADHIIQSGHGLIEMEKAKTAQELKGMAVNMVLAATEKVLREKLDPVKDGQLIDESLKGFSA